MSLSFYFALLELAMTVAASLATRLSVIGSLGLESLDIRSLSSKIGLETWPLIQQVINLQFFEAWKM